jgi:hypothetical protein
MSSPLLLSVQGVVASVQFEQFGARRPNDDGALGIAHILVIAGVLIVPDGGEVVDVDRRELRSLTP